MPENKEVMDSSYVKNQTLFGSVIVALVVGFVSGTIYSSFKLAPDTMVPHQGSAAVAKNSGGEPDHDHTAEFAAEILKLEQYLKTHPEDADKWAQLGNYFFDSDQFKKQHMNKKKKKVKKLFKSFLFKNKILYFATIKFPSNRYNAI